MKLHYSALLIPAVLALSACSEDSVNDGTTESFENLLASIEYEDANLQTCVEDAIESQGVNKTSDLQYFSCTKKLDSLAGLENFTELRGIDMVKSDLSCANLDKLDKELFANATTLGDDTPAVVTQPDSCFYNYLEFADDAFRTCVVEQFAVNGWTSLEDVTNLACDSLNIVSMGGVEQFPNLADFDISKTAINCDNTASFATANEAILVTAPEVCIIENVVLNSSDDVAACLAAGAGDSKFVVELKELTCSDPEFKDTKGLELLSSLTSLVLTDTSVDCYANRHFEKTLLPAVEYAAPTKCVMTPESLLTDILPATDNPEDPIFIDEGLQTCYEELIVTNDWVQLKDVTNFTCPGSVYKDIASIEGMQNFTSMTKLQLNKVALTDLSPLKDLTNLTDLGFPFASNLQDIDSIEYLVANVPQLTRLQGWKGMNTELLPQLDLVYLKAHSSQLDDEDVVNIGKITNLTEVTLANSPLITSLAPLFALEFLIKVDINHAKTGPIKCTEIEALRNRIGADGNPAPVEVVDNKFTCSS